MIGLFDAGLLFQFRSAEQAALAHNCMQVILSVCTFGLEGGEVGIFRQCLEHFIYCKAFKTCCVKGNNPITSTREVALAPISLHCVLLLGPRIIPLKAKAKACIMGWAGLQVVGVLLGTLLQP